MMLTTGLILAFLIGAPIIIYITFKLSFSAYIRLGGLPVLGVVAPISLTVIGGCLVFGYGALLFFIWMLTRLQPVDLATYSAVIC